MGGALGVEGKDPAGVSSGTSNSSRQGRCLTWALQDQECERRPLFHDCVVFHTVLPDQVIETPRALAEVQAVGLGHVESVPLSLVLPFAST